MPREYPRLKTARTMLLLPGPEFAARMVDYYRRNDRHLAPWEPRRPPDFLTAGWWERQLEANRREFREDRGARLVATQREDREQRVVAVANLSNIVRGAFQACHVGYSVDSGLEGQGYMHEILEELVRYAFEDLRLHRLMANHQPENERSGRLLSRLGFEREGYAKAYLHIDGAWRDHVLTALLNPRDPLSRA